MQVAISEVWATPSTLHVKVIVGDDAGKWHHRYYPSIPLDEIPEEAVIMLTQRYLDGPIDETKDFEPLF